MWEEPLRKGPGPYGYGSIAGGTPPAAGATAGGSLMSYKGPRPGRCALRCSPA
ncbi:hypothetical protein DUNSADRAFT_5296 [Dunaliella salina]|uniref:Encoded protein n=1 Tax=Dunaliella salina TaxID=3046 RepID=A0ABQ7FUE6_DUNSA|nr:hypothetical protein DUNSADRAFT_5296 [Dunaliella salina]|eukprot:KAF5826033.1 hypothetical protein DUNSADRAFT_5296 [Dunaliella salina]